MAAQKCDRIKLSPFVSLFLILILQCYAANAAQAAQHSEEVDTSAGLTIDQVRAHLLEHYDVKTPPRSEDGQHGVKVGLGMTLSYFTLEESDHVFLVNAWMRMTWQDHRLKYDSSITNGTYFHFGNGEIWQPDLTLYNNAFPTEIDHYGDTHLLVKPDGTVLWLPPARLAAHCTMNMIRWPYDTHTCELKIGSWTHHGEEVDLYYMGESNDTSDNMIDNYNFVKNAEWILLQSKAARNAIIYECCSEPYIDVTFSFTFQRESPSYIISFVVPIIFISFVNTLALLLPPSCGEKILLGAVNFFILCIFLLFFQAKLPPLGDHLPLLVVLYGCNLALVTISLGIAVLVLNLTRTRRVSTLPHCLRILCNIHFATALGLGHITPFVSQTHSRFDDGVEMQSPIGASSNNQGRGSQHASASDLNGDIKDSDRANLVVDDVEENPFRVTNAEWVLLACMIDRVAFVSYVIINAIILGICLG